MNTKHTPEPWVTVHHANGQQSLIQSNAKHLAECWSLDKKIDSQANAARIVACVNACAGMDDPAKEIATLRARIAELERYRPDPSQWKTTPPTATDMTNIKTNKP